MCQSNQQDERAPLPKLPPPGPCAECTLKARQCYQDLGLPGVSRDARAARRKAHPRTNRSAWVRKQQPHKAVMHARSTATATPHHFHATMMSPGRGWQAPQLPGGARPYFCHHPLLARLARRGRQGRPPASLDTKTAEGSLCKFTRDYKIPY